MTENHNLNDLHGDRRGDDDTKKEQTIRTKIFGLLICVVEVNSC